MSDGTFAYMEYNCTPLSTHHTQAIQKRPQLLQRLLRRQLNNEMPPPTPIPCTVNPALGSTHCSQTPLTSNCAPKFATLYNTCVGIPTFLPAV